MIVSGADALNALLLCGMMGVLGQGVRAAVGLKGSNPNMGAPNPQSAFSAAYFALSLMIGFIAGVGAGLLLGLQNFTHVNLADVKSLLGIAASGYAGADFIENSLSIVIRPPAQQAASAATTSATTATAAQPATALLAAAAPAPSIASDGSNSLAAALSIVAPGVNRSTWLQPLLAAFAKFDVTNNKRKAVAIGQFLVEAGASFQEVVENLNYTHADHIAAVFPHAFPTAQSAQPFVGNSQALADRVYANRLGNGDEQSGDGYRFRGRGLIQLTGRDEYAEFGATIGKSAEDTAAYCETPEGAAASGCWYLSARGCLSLADAWEISLVTRKVNGAAMLGNAQRIAYAQAMLKHLGT
ncbi:MAG: glycoside hydrolase family 19 protein [Proteobacteria bacterium]|nr:glycoside hydrolase family 19 protein [Pseudomonadota bacterium]